MRNALPLLVFATLLATAGCGEPAAMRPVLTIRDTNYSVEDFTAYLGLSRPTVKPPFDPLVLENYLQEFMEHTLLLRAARDAGIEPKGAGESLDRELRAVSEYLYNAAYSQITVDEDMIAQEYEEKFTESRVRIQSVFFSDEKMARDEYQRLSRRPDEFEAAMEQYNSQEIMDLEMGQGVFTRFQLPESVRDAVFQAEEPGVIGPIDLDKGFVVVKVVEFLDRPGLDEVRQELADQIAARLRNTMRARLIEDLKKQYRVETNIDAALAAEGLVGEKQTRTKQ